MTTTLFSNLAGDLSGEPGRRPPLVLLHGLTFDRTSWHPALAELAMLDPGRQVLALDLPGHGGSPPWPRYDLEPIADAIHRAVAEAGLSARPRGAHEGEQAPCTARRAVQQPPGLPQLTPSPDHRHTPDIPRPAPGTLP